jgi:hypothetical protein
MACQVALLGEHMETQSAGKGLGLCVLLEMVFEVAGFLENLVAVLVQTFEPLVVPTCLGIDDPHCSIPVFWYSREVVFETPHYFFGLFVVILNDIGLDSLTLLNGSLAHLRLMSDN